MRKYSNLLLAVLAAFGLTVATGASAMDAKKLYVQADLGVANLDADFDVNDAKFKNFKKSYDKSGFLPRVSVGYELGTMRVAADYTHYKKVTNTETQGTDTLSTKATAQGLGVSAIYNIPMQSDKLQPYVGVRVAANKVKFDVQGNNGYTSNTSKTKAGFGALVGADYKINDKITADVGYRYNQLNSDLKSHEMSVGMRYTF